MREEEVILRAAERELRAHVKPHNGFAPQHGERYPRVQHLQVKNRNTVSALRTAGLGWIGGGGGGVVCCGGVKLQLGAK